MQRNRQRQQSSTTKSASATAIHLKAAIKNAHRLCEEVPVNQDQIDQASTTAKLAAISSNNDARDDQIKQEGMNKSERTSTRRSNCFYSLANNNNHRILLTHISSTLYILPYIHNQKCDICIIGAGPAALATLSAIHEPYTLDSMTPTQVNSASESLRSSNKNNKGVGPSMKKVCVVDPSGDWLGRWNDNFDR